MDQDTINASGGEKQKTEGKSYNGRRKIVRQSLVKQNWNAILEFFFFFF